MGLLSKERVPDLYNIMENTQDEGFSGGPSRLATLVFGLAGLRQGEDGRPTVHPGCHVPFVVCVFCGYGWV